MPPLTNAESAAAPPRHPAPPPKQAAEPLTFRGIDYDQLKRLKEAGASALQLAPLRSEKDVALVLRHPLLVVRGDAAGIARKTGIVTSDAKLKELAAHVTERAVARQLLQAHGEQVHISPRSSTISPDLLK